MDGELNDPADGNNPVVGEGLGPPVAAVLLLYGSRLEPKSNAGAVKDKPEWMPFVSIHFVDVKS